MAVAAPNRAAITDPWSVCSPVVKGTGARTTGTTGSVRPVRGGCVVISVVAGLIDKIGTTGRLVACDPTSRVETPGP